MLERLAEVGGEVQSIPVSRQQLLEARLVDVHAPHLAAQLGKAGRTHQPDISGADHPDRLAL